VTIEKAVTQIKAAKGKKSGADLALSESGLSAAGLVPDTIKPATLARKAKAVIEEGKPVNSAKGGGGSTYREPVKTPEEKASEAHEEAVNKWKETAGGKLAKALNAKPLRRLFWLLAEQTLERSRAMKPNGYYYGHDAAKKKAEDQAKARAVAGQERTRKYFETLADPKANDILEMAEDLREYDRWEFRGFVDDALVGMATAMGIELAAVPKLEDFLPKPKAEKPAAAPAKKGKGKKAAQDDKPADDDEAPEPAPANVDDYVATLKGDRKRVFARNCWKWLTTPGTDEPTEDRLDVITRQGITARLEELAIDAGIELDPEKSAAGV
jgi:hypothetical protein